MIRAITFALALGLSASVTQPVLAGDPIIGFEETDPQMSAAIKNAHRTLPHFYRQAQGKLSSGEFTVKVAFPVEGGGNEHIWVSLLARSGKNMEGRLLNNPVNVPYKIDQKVEFTESSLSDWSYWGSDGKLHGNYTTRVMLPHLSAADAAQMRAILAPLP